jgi:hypothetical protein
VEAQTVKGGYILLRLSIAVNTPFLSRAFGANFLNRPSYKLGSVIFMSTIRAVDMLSGTPTLRPWLSTDRSTTGSRRGKRCRF